MVLLCIYIYDYGLITLKSIRIFSRSYNRKSPVQGHALIRNQTKLLQPPKVQAMFTHVFLYLLIVMHPRSHHPLCTQLGYISLSSGFFWRSQGPEGSMLQLFSRNHNPKQCQSACIAFGSRGQISIQMKPQREYAYKDAPAGSWIS